MLKIRVLVTGIGLLTMLGGWTISGQVGGSAIELSPAATAAGYRLVDLHPPTGFSFSTAFGISRGKIVGAGYNGTVYHALLWSGSAGSVVDLHPVSPFPCAAGYYWPSYTCIGAYTSVADGIDGDQIAGFAGVNVQAPNSSSFSTVAHRLLWSLNGSVVSLQPSQLYNSNVAGNIDFPSVIGGGQQAGVGQWPTGPSAAANHAFLWSSNATSAVDLHPSGPGGPGESRAHGTDGLQQVGSVGNPQKAALWLGTAASYVDLHPSSALSSEAIGIHGGVQVGYGYEPDGRYHARLWTGTKASAIDLGYGIAFATNGRQHVGSSNPFGFGGHAMLWRTGSAESALDLHPPGFLVSSANGIDESGNIVGSGVDGSGVRRALLWKNTAVPVAVPVIVIPGVMGTSLKRNEDLIWYDPIKAVNPLDPHDSFLNVLALDINGNGDPAVQLNGILDGTVWPGSIVQDLNHYGPLVAGLKVRGYSEEAGNQSLFIFAYDWRLNNEENALRLNDFIENKVKQPKVDIVAHSMGGLVARRYASRFGSGRLRKVIYLGTPHLGAPKTFGPMAYDSSLATLMKIPNINDQTLARLSRTFPAAFQLLPRNPFILAVKPSREFLTLEQSYLQPPNGLGLLKSTTWVEAAKSFHNSIATSIGAAQFQIVGSGIPTLTTLTLLTGLSETPRTLCGVAGNGDGTVPISSASAAPGAFATSTFYVPVMHENFGRDVIVGQLVSNILLDLPLNGIPGVTTQVPAATKGVVEWCTASPIKVTVADNAGRINQIGPDGSTRVEIPRSDFFVFEHNESGFLVSDQPYRFSIAATATGLFSFMLQEKNAAGSVVATRTFTDIPVVQSSRADVMFVPGSSEGTLTLDIDGDGTTDFSVSSNQSLTAVVSIQILARIIMRLPLESGIANSLLAKVEQAERAVGRGEATTARNVLNALQAEIRAQLGKKISPSDAQSLTAIIDSILTRL